MSEFYTVDIPVPPSLARLFKTIRVCSNGAVVVAYHVPMAVDGVNVGDETIGAITTPLAPVVVTPGAMVALDVRRLELEGVIS